MRLIKDKTVDRELLKEPIYFLWRYQALLYLIKPLYNVIKYYQTRKKLVNIGKNVNEPCALNLIDMIENSLFLWFKKKATNTFFRHVHPLVPVY